MTAFAAARARRWLGNALMAAGVLVLVLAAGGYAYGGYERAQTERALEARDRADAATATVAALLEPTPAPAAPTGVVLSAVPLDAVSPAPTATALLAATLIPDATPTPRGSPTPVAIRRIAAPAIGLDAGVVEAPVEDGEWRVPKFVAGHLAGTAAPGQGSNVVLSGHLQSLTSGNVFARIDELRPGDEVTLRTTAGEARYRVGGKNLVTPDDLSVVRPTAREELTLITCWGSYNALTQDYTPRLVVWAERVG